MRRLRVCVTLKDASYLSGMFVIADQSEMLNAFTVDVEDYFQVTGFENDIPRQKWNQFESRVEFNTLRLLELLERYDVKATFFVLGWIADQFPDLVKAISEAGHEIGSHSYWHRLIYTLTPQEFQRDLARSRDVLHAVTGQPITSFRAPSFSITERSRWALAELSKAGFKTDSSIYPIKHDRYGMPGANTRIHTITTEHGDISEMPMTVRKVAGVSVPVSGGGYFRLYPQQFTSKLLKRVNRSGEPFVFYIHPWELDAGQPRLKAGTAISRWRHYLNLESTESKLRHILQEFEFGPLSKVIAESQGIEANRTSDSLEIHSSQIPTVEHSQHQ